MKELSSICGGSTPTAAAAYRALFELAQRSSVAKLWNGEYFSYDTASEYQDDIMADQLAGQWYATTLGLGENEQAHEVWTGTTYGLAALMLAEGMVEEAYRTARGVYTVAWRERGYWFRTPGAWDEEGRFRASTSMRPAAIWAMEMVAQP